jgi:outer membrane protein assembly factor BamB
MKGMNVMAMKRAAEPLLLSLVFWGLPLTLSHHNTHAADWLNWRGPNHDGVSQEKLATWPAGGPKLLWKIETGPGHSNVAVRGDKVYTMGRSKHQDVIYCLSADTGETIWRHMYPAKEASYGVGPRATPAVDGKAVYTLSADGQVFCLDAASGEAIWKKDLVKELNVALPLWEFGCSPIVDDRMLLLNAGATGMALDKTTGSVVWRSEGDASYSSAVPFRLGDRRCMALLAATQLVVADTSDGHPIATFEWKTRDNANCSDALIVGNKIFITSSYGRGCALLSISGGKAALVWKQKYECHYSSPVLVGDYIYALVGTGWMKADLACLSVADGSEKWQQKNVGSGGLIAAGGRLLVLGRNGDLIMAEASPAKYTELARWKPFSVEAADASESKKPPACWNSPVFCNGRIYARNEKGTLVCSDVRGR